MVPAWWHPDGMVDSHADNLWISLAIMRLQQLKLILAIAEHGSLRASAQVLHVTQPALTKSLRQLEDEIGAPLVIRTPHGVRLAPAGEILAARAGTALRELEQARADIDWQVRHERARLAVGLSPVAGILLAPGAVARFCARVSGVRLRIVDAVFPRAQALIRSGEIDLAIGPLPAGEQGSDLVAQPLFESANVVVARASHPRVAARHLAELAAARWVLVGPLGGPGDPAGLGWGAAGVKPPEVRLECESFSTLLAMMSSDDLLATVPRGFLERYGRPMSLVELPVQDELPVTTVQAIRRADSPLGGPSRLLLQSFVHEARFVVKDALPEAAPGPPALPDRRN